MVSFKSVAFAASKEDPGRSRLASSVGSSPGCGRICPLPFQILASTRSPSGQGGASLRRYSPQGEEFGHVVKGLLLPQ